MNRYDLITFVRALGVSAGAGLIVWAIVNAISATRGKIPSVALIGVVILSTVAISAVWPTLTQVPKLDNLSGDRAEQLLVDLALVPAARPQHVAGVEPGRVVPNSQDPVAGLDVKPGTVVSFAVAMGGSGPPPPLLPLGRPTVSLFQPRAGATFPCARRPDGVGSIAARGTVEGIGSGAFELLLWLRPVNPPSDVSGWYLQRLPEYGVTEVNADGSWSGTAQVGNAQWPPQEGAVIDLAVSVADHDTAARLMAEPGVVIRPQPIGVVSATAARVALTCR